MKKFYKMIASILITLFVLVSPLSINAEDQEKTGRELIPDPVFYNYIVGKANLSADFTAKDLEEKVTSIRYYPVNDERIKDVTGIEHMTNLIFIDLQFNDISSLEPLKKAASYPKLKQLMLSNYIPTYSYGGTNTINDLSMLTGTRFPVLKNGIHLVNTKITDEVLATLPQADKIPKLFIDLQGNEITNIEPLRVYKDANIVRLDFNKIENIEPISEMNEFYYISLQNNLISDLSGLTGFEGSVDGELILSNNSVLDLSPLSSFKGSWINADGFADHTTGYFPEEGTYWNGGQRVKLTTPVIGNLETGEVTVESSAIYVDGDISPIVENSTNMIDGDVIGISKKYTLNPSSTDSITYVARSYFNVNGVYVAYYGIIEQPIIWKSSQSSVNVHYVDELGNKIDDSIELNGTIGTSYISEKKEIEGYTFKETIGEPAGLFEDTVITVSYIYTKNTPVVNKYTVSYTDGVDNEVIFNDQVYSNIIENSLTPSFQGTPTRPGYNFAGWHPAVAETVTGDATYVAQWKKIEVPVKEYTVSYTDGVDNEVIFEDQVYSNIIANSTTPLFQGTPTRSGYTFGGWLPEVSATVTADVTYVAQWKKIDAPVVNKYTVSYTDGVDNEVIFTDQVYSNIIANSTTPLFQGTPTRNGYTFEGWLPEVSATVTADVTYEAQWKKIEVVEQKTDTETPKLPTTGMSDNYKGLMLVSLGGLLMVINGLRKKTDSKKFSR